MARAYLDTSILADVLLKPGTQAARRAQDALSSFEGADVHGYAIKELKAGPLKNFAWMHNKLVIGRSYVQALTALQAMSLTPRRYTTATAIEALRNAARAVANETPASLGEQYGRDARIDAILADRFRLAISARVLTAWKKRYRLAQSVYPLACYTEAAPFKDNYGFLQVKPTECNPKPDCCMGPDLRLGRDKLRLLREAVIRHGRGGREDQRKTRTLKEILKKDVPVTEKMCRALGDVVFAFFAPQASIILTTNERDHSILALALGKKIKTP